jgi:hypothetical protein
VSLLGLTGWAAAILLSGVFAAAVVAHLREPERLAGVADQLRVPRVVLVIAVGYESGLVPLLLLSPGLGGLAAASYLTVTTGFVGLTHATGPGINDCGCSPSPHPPGTRWLVRNLVLIGAGVLAGVVGPIGLSGLGLVCGALTLVASSGAFVWRTFSLGERAEVSVDP